MGMSGKGCQNGSLPTIRRLTTSSRVDKLLTVRLMNQGKQLRKTSQGGTIQSKSSILIN